MSGDLVGDRPGILPLQSEIIHAIKNQENLKSNGEKCKNAKTKKTEVLELLPRNLQEPS